MKQFLINTASNTLTAVALAGALVMAAPAAKADTRDVVGGFMLGLILTEVLGNKTQQQPTQQQPQTVILRDKPNCGHFENLDYQGAYVVWTKFNACTGQVVAQEVRSRY